MQLHLILRAAGQLTLTAETSRGSTTVGAWVTELPGSEAIALVGRGYGGVLLLLSFKVIFLQVKVFLFLFEIRPINNN